MTISKSEWEYEEEHLEHISKKIQDQLDKSRKSAKSFKKCILSTRISMWENISHSSNDFDKVIEIKQYLDELKQEGQKYKISHDTVQKLEKLRESPYFARIDFVEEGVENREKIYIGISTLIDDETREVYIYDWRAPISSMFYEYELGPSGYLCPAGEIKGDILLKRQYRISNRKINYMFDSSIKIDDEVLQELLSKNSDEKMRNIVMSIQKEQNRIIRDDKNQLLIVQGSAGSGKTSIALHRIAYLLYTYKSKKLGANNIVIFSPNQIFNDYISNVLPELGEENMQQTTFIEYARKFLGPGVKIEDMNEQMEYIFSSSRTADYETRVSSIQYKASDTFLEVLKNYAAFIEREGISFYDITYRGKLIVSKEELKELFHKDYKRWPVVKRLEKLRERIYYLVAPFQKERVKQKQLEMEQKEEHKGEAEAAGRLAAGAEFRELREFIEKMTTLNFYDAYCKLFDQEDREFRAVWGDYPVPENFTAICAQTLERLKNRIISYDDVSPLLLLKGELEGVPNLSEIKHVVVDEAQDYTLMQYEIFKKLFPEAGITMLGDLNQSIHPFMSTKSYETIVDIFGTDFSEVLRLSKSYRSTREIVEFSRAVLGKGEKVEAINRSGDKPVIVKVPEGKQIWEVITEKLSELRKEGIQSAAVICKTAEECLIVYNHLEKQIDVNHITKDDEEFKKGIAVIPAYLAKGLEFDTVILYDAGADEYGREEEKKLFYTACTRAMHRLYIYYKGKATPFLDRVGSNLYTNATGDGS